MYVDVDIYTHKNPNREKDKKMSSITSGYGSGNRNHHRRNRGNNHHRNSSNNRRRFNDDDNNNNNMNYRNNNNNYRYNNDNNNNNRNNNIVGSGWGSGNSNYNNRSNINNNYHRNNNRWKRDTSSTNSNQGWGNTNNNNNNNTSKKSTKFVWGQNVDTTGGWGSKNTRSSSTTSGSVGQSSSSSSWGNSNSKSNTPKITTPYADTVEIITSKFSPAMSSWRGTQLRNKSVAATVRNMNKSKSLSEYKRGYGLLLKQGWDPEKNLKHNSQIPVVPQLTPVEGAGLGSKPLGFGGASMMTVVDDDDLSQQTNNNNNRSGDNTNNSNKNGPTLLQLNTDGKYIIKKVGSKLTDKEYPITQITHFPYLFEEEYPQIFNTQTKGEKCYLEVVKTGFFHHNVSLQLESTDFQLYVAKCEFSRKRWDYQNGQEQVAKQQMGKGKKKRGGLGLQSNGEIFRTEKLEWQKKKGRNKFAHKYFNISCFGPCFLIFVRKVQDEELQYGNIRYDLGIVDTKLMELIISNCNDKKNEQNSNDDDVEMNDNENKKVQQSYYIKEGLRRTRSGFDFRVLSFVRAIKQQ